MNPWEAEYPGVDIDPKLHDAWMEYAEALPEGEEPLEYEEWLSIKNDTLD